MSVLKYRETPQLPDAERPICPQCGVPMWLQGIQDILTAPVAGMLHFECRACGAKAVIPPLK
jgi:hypothetical protein